MLKVLAVLAALAVGGFEGERGVVVLVNGRAERTWVQFHMPRAMGMFEMDAGERVVIKGVHFDAFFSVCLDEDGDGMFTMHERVFAKRGRRLEYRLK